MIFNFLEISSMDWFPMEMEMVVRGGIYMPKTFWVMLGGGWDINMYERNGQKWLKNPNLLCKQLKCQMYPFLSHQIVFSPYNNIVWGHFYHIKIWAWNRWGYEDSFIWITPDAKKQVDRVKTGGKKRGETALNFFFIIIVWLPALQYR